MNENYDRPGWDGIHTGVSCEKSSDRLKPAGTITRFETHDKQARWYMYSLSFNLH